MEEAFKKMRIQYVPGPNCEDKKVGTFVAFPSENNTILIGFALCSKGDEFKKSVGRDIAIRRAIRWGSRTYYKLFGGEEPGQYMGYDLDKLAKKYLSTQCDKEGIVPVNWSQKAALIQFIKKVTRYFKGYNLPVWAKKLVEES